MRTRSPNLTPEVKRVIGEYAAKNGVTAAVRKYKYSAGSVSKCRKEYGQQNLLTVKENQSPSSSRYTQEFRQQLANSWARTRNYNEVARRYGVDSETVSRAVKDFVAEQDTTSTWNDEQNTDTSEFENRIDSFITNVEERLEKLAKRIDALSSAVEIMTDVVFEKAEALETMRNSNTNDRTL